MIPKIKAFSLQNNYLLFAEFDDGKKVIYNINDDIEKTPFFIELKDNIITKYVNKSISYTSYNNTNFGINATSFINKYNNDNTNEYYLFFNKKSNKIGELSTNDSLNDSALSLLSSII